MEDLQNQAHEPEQEAVDPIVLLGQELAEIRKALGLGSDASNSSLLKRLDAIETSLAKDQHERSLPATITRAQAADPRFLRQAGVSLKHISSGKVRVEG